MTLPTKTRPDPEPDPSSTHGLHGAAIAGMALSALVGIASMLAFVTIGWPEDSRRYVVAVFALAIVGFMVSASAAVFAAARATYPRSQDAADDSDSDDI